MTNGFDFSAKMRAVCEDMADRLASLRHVRMDRVAVTVSQARKNTAHGVYATLTPLRFADGARFKQENGARYKMQRVLDPSGQEYLYLLSFYLPRFLDGMPFEEKVATIVHELWHVNPGFNGDVRRYPGRYYVHSRRERHYDQQMREMAMQWLAMKPPQALYDFLQCDFRQLQQRHGSVHGLRVRHPRILRVGQGSDVCIQ